MPHPLEDEYGLNASELLDAVNERFRLKVALEGAVAEVHFEKKLYELELAGVIMCHEKYDKDDYPDFSVWLSENGHDLKIEVKNIRDAEEAYRNRSTGEIEAYKVELQKTRRGEDPSSRYYDADRFDIVAVCLGKKTGNWGEFFYAKSVDLARSKKYPHKLDVMHRVPLPESVAPPSVLGRDTGAWHDSLENVFNDMRSGR